MSGNDQKVLLDFNSQGFQQELFELDAHEIKKVFKTLRKISGLLGHRSIKTMA